MKSGHNVKVLGMVISFLVLAATTEPVAAGVLSEADAKYQSLQPGVARDAFEFPPTLAVVNVDDPTDSFSLGKAQSFSNVSEGIELRTLASTLALDPSFGPPEETSAFANNESTSVWGIISQTLPFGTEIDVALPIEATGELAASQFFLSDPEARVAITAKATASLRVSAGGASLGLYTAEAIARASPTGGSDPPILERAAGEWQGDFTPGSIGSGLGSLPGYVLDTADVLTFPARVGESFEVDFHLRTEVLNLPGPREVFAHAEFTAVFGLEARNPITGEVLGDVNIISVVYGDANSDGAVDIDDLNDVGNNFNQTGPRDGTLLGDTFPFDGVVDITDWNAVRNAFCQSTGGRCVPEPTGLGMLALAMVLLFGPLRHRRGSSSERRGASGM